MEYKVTDLIKALDGLPPPEYVGQKMNVPIWELLPMSFPNGNQRDIPEKVPTIIVEAQVFCMNSRKWLDWVIEIK